MIDKLIVWVKFLSVFFKKVDLKKWKPNKLFQKKKRKCNNCPIGFSKIASLQLWVACSIKIK
jgi:hypothetical protein